jgi:HSP20 family protein
MRKDKRRSPWDDFFLDIDDEFDDIRGRIDRILGRIMENDTSFDNNPLIYGFSMKVGPDGKPRIQEFGNTTAPDKYQESRREPLTDVIEEDDRVRVVVELPGVEKEDILLDTTEDTLSVEVDTPNRRFSRKLDLSCCVDPESAKATYNNGVLEVCLARVERNKNSKKIVIE